MRSASPFATAMQPAGRPEDRLILACAGCVPGTDVDDPLVERVTDWDLLVRVAIRNRVEIPLANALLGREAVPLDVRRRLLARRTFIEHEVALVKRRVEGMLPTILRFNRVMLLRGIAFAYTIYATSLMRRIGDCDLLIDTPTAPSLSGKWRDHHHVPAAVRKIATHALEYHHDLNVRWCASVSAIAMPELWRRQQRITVGGAEVGAPAAEDHFVYICSHNVAKGFVKLYRFMDLAMLTRRAPFDWSAVVERSKRFGLARAVWLNCQVLERMCPGIVPGQVTAGLRPHRVLSISISRVLSIEHVLHDPNPSKQNEDSSRLRNLRKLLLVALVLIRPGNVASLACGRAVALLLSPYDRLCRTRRYGPFLRAVRARLQHEEE
jgi:hypothetical protein